MAGEPSERITPGRAVIATHAMTERSRIKVVGPWFRGDQMLRLHDGATLSIGRALRPRLKAVTSAIP
jgi:hypothetical protein